MGTSAAIASVLAGTNNGGTNTSNSTSALNNLGSNFTTFLNLLTTQLKNQDPTNPVDSTQFTQQLVEFTGVQQQVQTNSYLQQMLTAMQGNEISSASSYIGTTIQATGSQTALNNGTASMGYTLASQASKVNVIITDSTGKEVFRGTGSTSAGRNIVTWNGTNSFTGASEPGGVYNVNVQATDAHGAPITATPFITGTVTSASISNGQVLLNLGALQVPVGTVTSVTNLSASKSASAT